MSVDRGRLLQDGHLGDRRCALGVLSTLDQGRSSITRNVALHAAGLVLAAGAGAAAGVAVTNLGLRTFSIAFIFALAHAVLLGLPFYILLRRRGRPRWWMALVGGFGVGALPIALLALVPAADQASSGGIATIINGSRTPAGWLEYLLLVVGAGGLGAIGGLAFGLTVRTTLQSSEPGGSASTKRGTRRTWLDGVLVCIAVLVPLVAVYLPAALEDRSCHNPMQGRTSLASEINASLSLDRDDWPTFAATMEAFAHRQGWSYRADVRPNPDFPWLQISACNEAGTQFTATSAPGLPGIQIGVYQPQGGNSWRAPFAILYESLQTNWPGRTSFDGTQGQRIATPGWLKSQKGQHR